MKRDDDLIRHLLFRYEADKDWLFLEPAAASGASEQEQTERYHMFLMMDEGLLSPVGRSTFRMTSKGHDFLDAIRDDTIWTKVKSGAAKTGAGSLDFMFGLAKEYVKQSVQEKLGIQL